MADTPTVIGVDLGGTKVALARFGVDGLVAEETVKIDTPDHFDAVTTLLIDRIATLRTDTTLAIGIGVPGLVNKHTNRILALPNIPGSNDRDLAGDLQRATKLAVAIGNDANLFTLAEARDGAGKGHDVVVGITIGTGVGGGIVIDGNIYRGAHGYAAEIGHMLLMPGKPPYETDDNRGDVEQFLSGTALGKRCANARDPSQYLRGETCGFLHPDIFREIAWMVVNVSHLIDPSIIVFGGSAGKALKPHLPAIHEELKQWMLPHAVVPKLAVGTLSGASMRGAAMIASTQA